MNDTTLPASTAPRSIWVRALLMLLMGICFHIAAWVLGLTALVQLVFAVFGGEANPRLREFGRSVGRYLAAIGSFVTFATEEVPFPFTDWPAGN